MKSRAESLDQKLDALKDSLEHISQLTTSINQSPSPVEVKHPPSDLQYDPLLHLGPLLALPTRLRSSSRQSADALWGSWEPALKSWYVVAQCVTRLALKPVIREEAGVKGIEDIADECREVLRRNRRPSIVQKPSELS